MRNAELRGGKAKIEKTVSKLRSENEHLAEKVKDLERKQEDDCNIILNQLKEMEKFEHASK